MSGGARAGRKRRLAGQCCRTKRRWPTFATRCRGDDGALVYVRSRGVRHGSAEILARLARGEDVDASEYTFRTATRIETAHPGLEWLNKGVVISVGGRRPGAVIYETYLVS